MIKKSNFYLEKYYQSCKAGETVVGVELLLELEALIEDQQSDDYIYNTTDADKRIDFIENCIRCTKSPFYGQPMKLLPFQKAFISALYGFKMTDGTDRFQRCLFLLARKNGKSELCSALLLTEMIIGGRGLDIVCSSNDDMQASILTDAVDTMRLMIDPESIDTRRNQRNIKCLFTDNKIFKLSDKTRNKEGRNIDIAVVDEVHEMKENVIVKSIEQSQSLKINPKLILITTEGFVNGGFLDEELITARAILNKEINNTSTIRYLPWLYTQDSEEEVWNGSKKNRVWEKSNPTLGIVKRYEYIEQQIDKARASKADRVFVLSKDFNIKQSTATAWLRYEDYSYDSNFDMEDFRNFLCIGGVDIGETTDLTSAKILLIKPDDNKKYILSMYFIPQGKLDKADDKGAGAKYEEWQERGLVRICEGNYTDTSIIADWFFELYQRYGLRPLKVGYDAKFANEFVNRMDRYGFEVEPVWQSPLVMTAPISMVEADLQTRLIAGLNEVDKWCIGNATLKVDNHGYCLLDKIKGQDSRRIDGAVSLCISYEIYRRYRTVYNDAINAMSIKEVPNGDIQLVEEAERE